MRFLVRFRVIVKRLQNLRARIYIPDSWDQFGATKSVVTVVAMPSDALLSF